MSVLYESREEGRKRRRLNEPGPATATNVSGPESFQLFSELPDEITVNILDRLDIVSKIRCRRVCKTWNTTLRDDSLLELVKIDEKSSLKFGQWRGHYTDFTDLFEPLGEAGVWKNMRHLIFEGGYDILSQEVHAGCRPYVPSQMLSMLIPFVQEYKHRHNMDSNRLETVQVRRAAVELDWFNEIWPGGRPLQCKFILVDGSWILTLNGHLRTWEIEFEVHGSRTFDLSGEMTGVESWELAWIPVEISEFIQEKCDTVPAEEISKLGEIYSDLLQGQPEMLIRWDVSALFDQISWPFYGEPNRYDPEKPHWQQCKNYDFNSMSKLEKYSLVYHAKPRNCFQMVTTQEQVDEHLQRSL